MAKSAPKPAKPAASLPPMAIFHGPERFLQLEHTESLRERLRAAHGEIAPTVFDGATAAPADILDECRSLSLMQQHRLVIVDNADVLLKGPDEGEDGGEPAKPASGRAGGGRSAREMLESYAASPDDSATLVLRAGVFRGPKLEKAVLAGGGVVIKCEPPSTADAIAWAVPRAKIRHDAVIERPAAAALIEAVGADLGRIDSELAKLAVMASARGDKAIGEDLVRLAVGLTREEEFWAIQGSLLSGDSAEALSHLRTLLDVSRHDPTPLLFTFGDLARKLHAAARGLAARENPFALKGRLRLWGPQADTLLHKAGKVNPDAAADLVRETVRAMVRQRTGDGDPEHILEGLTLRFSAVCAV